MLLLTQLQSCALFFFIFSDILEPFLKAAPTLEVLHIGLSNRTARSPWTTVEIPNTDFLKTISRCGRLTTLRLNAFNLFEGDFFETVYAAQD
jgi:hypothetical protein